MVMNDEKMMSLAIQAMEITFYLSAPALLVALFIGIMISIFQATTQINEMTLTFVPKIIGVTLVLIFTMPWMMNKMVEFTTNLLKSIPTFIF